MQQIRYRFKAITGRPRARARTYSRKLQQVLPLREYKFMHRAIVNTDNYHCFTKARDCATETYSHGRFYHLCYHRLLLAIRTELENVCFETETIGNLTHARVKLHAITHIVVISRNKIYV